MAEDTCKREMVIEVPAEVVQREAESIARSFQKQARIAGFRPGKAPLDLIRRRFAEQIRQQMLENLIPEHFRHRVEQEKLEPVASPEIADVEVQEDAPLRFKATFEVLPQFELKDYRSLEVESSEPAVSEEEVEQALLQAQEQAATYAPVEERPLADGDFAVVSFEGRPEGQPAPRAGSGPGAPVKMSDVLCEIGGRDTLPEFTENLRGAQVGEERSFPVNYPADFSDRRLAGRTFRYTVHVHGIKQKQLPELNDDLARDLGEFQTLEELRAHLRRQLEEQKRRRAEAEAKEKLLDRLVELHDFPVPDALVDRQLQKRLEQTLRGLAAQGVNVGQLKVDWSEWRARQRPAALRDVKAGLVLDAIAGREGIQVEEGELEREVERLAAATKQSTAVVRSRLTREGALDRMKSRLRSEKTHDFLFHSAQRAAPRA